MKQYFKSILPNGLTVISHVFPYVNSAVIGLWVNVGSIDESESQEGFSHFTEHMLFKGTSNYSAGDIVRSIERLGGDINAYTSKEHTCYITNILGKDYKESLNTLLDICFNSTMEDEQFELEKTVVLNELAATEDEPEDLITDKLYEKIFSGSTLGHSILGTKKSIYNCSRKQLFDFYKKNYIPKNITITCTGNIKHDEICNYLSEYKILQQEQSLKKQIEKAAIPLYSNEIIIKDYEQVHCVIAFPCVPYNSADRYQAITLNNLLGEGMSSRLFQNIREKYGFVYNIYSDLNFFRDISLITIYFSSEQSNFNELLKHVIEEINKLKNKTITEIELQETKGQLIGSSMISMDDMDTEMTVLARSHFYTGRYIPLDEAVQELNKVTQEQINLFANKTFTNSNFGIIIAGNIKDNKSIEVIINELKN